MAAQQGRGISSSVSSEETSSGGSPTQLSALGSAPGTLTDEPALFECPVCLEIAYIMRCQVGHSVCANCYPELPCPTCRGTLGNIRNLAMEKLSNKLMFPCKHESTGCRMSLDLFEKAEHEEVCQFRPCSCPCFEASCSWQGQLDKVMVHIQHSHENITTLNGDDIVFLATEINLVGPVNWAMIQSCFGHHFMILLVKQEKNYGITKFYAIVQLIDGSRKQAERFAYHISCKRESWPHHQLIGPLMKYIEQILKLMKCLERPFNKEIITHFSGFPSIPKMWRWLASSFRWFRKFVVKRIQRNSRYMFFLSATHRAINSLALNGNRRRLIWEGIPRSSQEGVASAIMCSDCLVFNNSIAQRFADNGKLGINVTIDLVR